MTQAVAAPRTLVTRPEREALQWVAALQARGLAAQALPLIAIAAPADAAALQAARERAAGYRAIMVVSGNAAQHFFDPKTVQTLSGQAQAAIKTRVWSPGPGTAQTLQALGLAADCIDQPAADAAQFESEALWAQVHGQVAPRDRILVVRGAEAGAPADGSGREWLAQQLRAAGAEVDFVVAYTRCAPEFTAAQRALAQQAAHDGSLWLLSSSQALSHLCAALPGQAWGQARALATHPRIAQAARAAGFGCVRECRPALADVAASIESAP
ncbi:uroporphyrinogen III synthase [Rhodococcus sp. SRB_17]|nr:uroporphyrinogen III synthase [Rhodococcus sp. SRB_17]